MRRFRLLLGLALTLAVTPFVVSDAGEKKYPPAEVAKGKTLFKQLACASCHSVDQTGGCLAPELDGVTQRRTEQYLILRLSSAKGDEDKFIELMKHQELVPHPRFPRAQVKSLIAYLSTLRRTKQ